jgi:uncharacterized membrane protein
MASSIPIPNDPEHIEETVRTIAELRAEHFEKAQPLERALDRVAVVLSRPWFLGAITLIIIGWIGSNLATPALGLTPIDPQPFQWLSTTVSVASLYIVILLLTVQRRKDQLAQHRELLILELTLLSEQKTAKVIQLLEEARRDNPFIRNRHDPEADAMAKPSNAGSVLDAIKEAPASTAE